MKNVTCVHLFAAALAAIFATDVRAQNATAESAWNLVESCQFWLAIESGEADKKFQKNDVASMGVTMVRAGYCPGYINGFIGGRSMEESPGSSLAFCVPKEVTTSQVARLLVKKLEEKPEFEHVSSLAFISGVLAATWPCGNKQNSTAGYDWPQN